MKTWIILISASFLAIPSLSAQACTSQLGQAYIDAGLYQQAVTEFTCVINAHPASVEGYRGRIEAQLLLGQYSNALADYGRVTAFVEPVDPNAIQTILDGYAVRLAGSPKNVPALTGASFAYWRGFEYPKAIALLNRLASVTPGALYPTLFLGSSRVLAGIGTAKGLGSLDDAIALAPGSPDVRFVVADAYTYGNPDPARAFTEANLALQWGLDTPRVHAILAVSYAAFGNPEAAAMEIQTHIQQVTTELITAPPLNSGETLSLALAPGRTYEIPVSLTAGQTLSIATGSVDFYDTILVVLAPDGTPVAASDDYFDYFAGLDWVATATGTFRLRVTSFEAINTGLLTVTRQ